jgi:hypothetical protein
VYQREMVLYTRNRSLRCWRAKRLLGRAGYRFEVVDATADPGALAELSRSPTGRSRHRTSLSTVARWAA